MDERSAKREVVDLEVAATLGGKVCRVSLYDLSMDGCMVDTGGKFPLRAGQSIQLDLPYVETMEATLLWTKGGIGGAKFSKRLHQAIVAQLGFRPDTKADTEFRDQFGRAVSKPGKRFSL